MTEFSEKIKLDIALRLLRAEVLEKKLDGMNELHSAIEMVNIKLKQESLKLQQEFEKTITTPLSGDNNGGASTLTSPIPAGPPALVPSTNNREGYTMLTDLTGRGRPPSPTTLGDDDMMVCASVLNVTQYLYRTCRLL